MMIAWLWRADSVGVEIARTVGVVDGEGVGVGFAVAGIEGVVGLF